MSEWTRVTSRGKRDRSEPEVIKALEAAGCAVQKLSAPGVPDLLVWFPTAESFELVEVKDGNEGLTPVQEKWWAAWLAKGGRRPHIVRNAAQATKLARVVEAGAVNWVEAVEQKRGA